MPLKRTTVRADADDLAVIRAAASRRGVPEAEILRKAIHRAALESQMWNEPFFSRTYEPLPEPSERQPQKAVRDIWVAKTEDYERTKGVEI